MNQPDNQNGPPVNFDREAEALRKALNAKGILLVVFEAQDRGTGISVRVQPEDFPRMPDILRSLTNRMERDIAFSKATRGNGKL